MEVSWNRATPFQDDLQWKIPNKNGWWLGVAKYVRKPPYVIHPTQILSIFLFHLKSLAADEVAAWNSSRRNPIKWSHQITTKSHWTHHDSSIYIYICIYIYRDVLIFAILRVNIIGFPHYMTLQEFQIGWSTSGRFTSSGLSHEAKPKRGMPFGISHIPSGKHTKNDGKSPFLMGKSTISMAIFHSKLFVYQRVLTV
jgi:hypothetical protein